MSLEVAREAWEHPDVKEGVTENFRGYRIAKGKRVLLTMPRESEIHNAIQREHDFSVVAYPQPHHMRDFLEASLGVRRQGPADAYPCSIGSLEAVGHMGAEGKKTKRWISINFAQAHYRTGTNDGALPRKLATRYAGWRKHAFRELAHLAKSNGFEIWVGKWALRPRSIVAPDLEKVQSQFHREILEVSRELGLAVHVQEGGILVNPLKQ